MQPWEAAQFGLLDAPTEKTQYGPVENLIIDWARKSGRRFGGLIEPERYPEEDAELRQQLQDTFLGDMSEGQLPDFGLGGSTNIFDFPIRDKYRVKDFFSVTENPTANELRKIRQDSLNSLKEGGIDYDVVNAYKDKDRLVRYLKHNNNILAWPSLDATHTQVVDLMNLRYPFEMGTWNPEKAFVLEYFLDNEGKFKRP
jgi:hypothetical protein